MLRKDKSRFNLGDAIKVVGLSLDSGKLGTIVGVNLGRSSYTVRLTSNVTKEFYEGSLSSR